MENKVEKIMNDYNEGLKKIDSKYEIKKPDTKKLEEKIKNLQDLIKELTYEGKQTNLEMINRVKEKLEIALKEKESIDKEYQEDKNNKMSLKNRLVISGNRKNVRFAERDEIDRAELRNKAIKDLTSEKKSISDNLTKRQSELSEKRKKWLELREEFYTDKEGKSIHKSTDESEVKKVVAEYNEIKKDIEDLEIKYDQCEKCLSELKKPTEKDINFLNILKNVSGNQRQPEQGQTEQGQPAQDQPVQRQPAQAQPAQGQPAQDQLAQGQTEQGQPAQDQPAQRQPEQGQPEQGQPEQRQPAQAQPAQDQPAQDQPAQDQPAQRQPEQGQPAQGQTEQDHPVDIYSNSKININAKEGKAYVTIRKKNNSNQEIKELDIEEIFENKKRIFDNLDLNALLKKAGVDSKFQKFIAIRKINPVIIEAINGNPDLMYDYIEAIIDEKEFPFKYKIDLTDSNLSKKTNSALNKLALKERKIEGNEVVGAERLYKIKNLFRGIKKQKAIKPAKEPEKLPASNNNIIRDDLIVDLDQLAKKQKEATNSAYSKLSQKQKSDLDKLSVSDIQGLGLGIDYNTAYDLKRTYGKDDTESSPAQNESDQVK